MPAPAPPQARRMAVVPAQLRSLAAYGVAPTVGIVTAPFLARALRPEGRGELAGVMQPITLAGALAGLGVPAAVAFYTGRGYSQRSVLRIGYLATLPSAVTVYLGLCAYAPVVAARLGVPVPVLLASWAIVVLSALVQVKRASWQGLGRFGRLDLERTGYALARLVGVVGPALAGVTAATGYVAAYLASFGLGAALLWCGGPGRCGPAPVADAGREPTRREVRRYSWLAAIGTISLSAGNRLDQLLLPAATSSRQLGFYAVAVTVAEVPLIAATVAARNLMHAASTGRRGGDLVRSASVVLAAGAGGCLGTAVLAPSAVPFVFGPAFAPSVRSVQILLLGSGLTIGVLSCTAVVSGRGRPGLGSLINVAGLAVTVVGFAVLWGRMDSELASAVSAASQAAALAVGLVLLRRVPAGGPGAVGPSEAAGPAGRGGSAASTE
ncbi:MAG TPA: oligosaccharide flippase family protein [Kineosporiaceae bacterium]